MHLIGVDVGGTFTDLIYTDTGSGQTAIHKVPTTTEDPSVGAIGAIVALCERVGIAPAAVGAVFHGTTIATNAVLEHDGARTGMVTNRGYRDILHIGRHQRPQNYSIMQDIPWQAQPLVRRRHRLVVDGRIAPPDGRVLHPLDEDGVRQAARRLRADGVEAIAVCFLFSYIDPAHELRARAIVEEECPDAFVVHSAGVAPQFREFERFTTAAMNAFIGPKVRRYVANLSDGLRRAGLDATLHIMGSHGGALTPSMVTQNPVLTLLSGPAAGVHGGAWSAGDRRRLITFDVGGTSADIGIVREGRITEAAARDTAIGGFPVLVPMIDIETIGAGGGSIAHVDRGGAFRVGPHSAGSTPGPACYGKGGTRPTVTDANLVLGRLDPDHFLGGAMALDAAAAERVIAELADALGLSPFECAAGTLTILNANMANAIRSRTVQKGLDPRDFALVAFGGAGPLHGAEVAELLGIPEVVIPAHPGITSAAGLLTTDLKYDAIKTEFMAEGAIDTARLGRDFDELTAGLAAQFAADGIGPEAIALSRSGELRYVGQGYELRIAFPPGPLDAAAVEAVFEAFHTRHRAEYGHAFRDSPIEIVNIRVVGSGAMPKLTRRPAAVTSALARARLRQARCMFRVDGALQGFETGYYDRAALPTGVALAGPAIILQTDTTTVVPPGWTVTADEDGTMTLRKDRQP
ncbi:MAG: hydantoinase/oxoprolinase family protein [Alphaproteobacteria bacterium]